MARFIEVSMGLPKEIMLVVLAGISFKLGLTEGKTRLIPSDLILTPPAWLPYATAWILNAYAQFSPFRT